MLNNDNKFDLDLSFGQIYELELLNALLGNITIEVKTERDIWVHTGNICIEYESRGKKSGISITKAKFWFHCLTNSDDGLRMAFVFEVERLKEWIRINYSSLKQTRGGDDNTSKIILIPIKDLHKIAGGNK